MGSIFLGLYQADIQSKYRVGTSLLLMLIYLRLYIKDGYHLLTFWPHDLKPQSWCTGWHIFVFVTIGECLQIALKKDDLALKKR